MLRIAIKIVIYSIITIVALFAGFSYSGYKFAVHISECASIEQLCELKNNKASNEEMNKFLSKVYTCVKEKQSFFEKLYAHVPDNFINPPPNSLSYKHIKRECKPLTNQSSGTVDLP